MSIFCKNHEKIFLARHFEKLFLPLALTEVKAGLPFWAELAQTSLNSDHFSYFGLKMGLNFPQKSDMENIYSK